MIIIDSQKNYPNDIEPIMQRIMGPDAARTVAFGIPNEELGTEMPELVCEVRRRYNESEQKALSRQIRYQVLQELNVTLADVRLEKKTDRAHNQRQNILLCQSAEISCQWICTLTFCGACK